MGKNNITVMPNDQLSEMRQTLIDQQRLIWALIKVAGGEVKINRYLLDAAAKPECQIGSAESVDKKSVILRAMP